VPSLRTNNPGDDGKKCQQAFLVSLLGNTNLVAMLRNVNKHFWHRCREHKPGSDVKKYQHALLILVLCALSVESEKEVWLAHKCAPTTQAWQEQSKLYFTQLKMEVLLEYN
jgi:hypothetical protein